MHRRLSNAAGEWGSSGREPSFLLSGSRLDQFEAWGSGTSLALGLEERGYLTASITRREEERAKEEVRRDRERTLERRSSQAAAVVVAVLAVAALVAASLTLIAKNQSNRAERESRIATARELAAAAVANLDVDAERSSFSRSRPSGRRAMRTVRSSQKRRRRCIGPSWHRASCSRCRASGAKSWIGVREGVFVTEGPEDTGVIDIRDATTGESLARFTDAPST